MDCKVLKDRIAFVVDTLFLPLTCLSALWLRCVRRAGLKRMRLSAKILKIIGVLPIRDHYYEPLFNPGHLRYSLRQDRDLPWIDLNDREQLHILSRFHFTEELAKIPSKKTDQLEFYYDNLSIGPGDSEYYYNMIRLFKPKKIIEVGCGYSTLMAVKAIRQNQIENKNYVCEYICIEPYENKWLEKLDLKVIREKVEDIDKKFLTDLETNDILFIDSSHVIRPQGDVLFEYLEVLPILKTGVLVHAHDIFTPKDYPDEWVLEDVKLWNEQYLLEAFLAFNKEYKVIGALNYLKHHYRKEIEEKCPLLKSAPQREPSSFWMVKAR